MRLQQHTLRWLLSRQVLVASAVANRAQALAQPGASASAGEWRPQQPANLQPADGTLSGMEAAEAYLQQAVRALAYCKAALAAAGHSTTLDWRELEEAQTSLHDVSGQVARAAVAAEIEPSTTATARATAESPLSARDGQTPSSPRPDVEENDSIKRLTAENQQLRSSLRTQRLQQRERDQKHAVELQELRLRERQLKLEISARSAAASTTHRPATTAGGSPRSEGSPVGTPPSGAPHGVDSTTPAAWRPPPPSSPLHDALGGSSRRAAGSGALGRLANGSPTRVMSGERAGVRERRGERKEMLSLRGLWTGTPLLNART